MGFDVDKIVPDDSLADLVPGRYAVERRIAKGGMATVYLAVDTVLQRQVAVKVLEAPKQTDPGNMLERFRLEAEALAKLNYRHIVAIYDYGSTAAGGYYLVMEYVNGPTLTRLLKEDAVTTEQGILIMVQVCRALRYAHKNGIIHRDLKTANILVTRDEDGDYLAKLVDFGLVKEVEGDDGMTQHGMILGTPHAMAPEQIRGATIDARTDIYAFGVTLYRVLVGRNPFVGQTAALIVAMHLKDDVPSFASVNPDLMVPGELESIVRKCLCKNPDDRYEDCSQLLNALRSVVDIPRDDYVSVSLVLKEEDLTPRRSFTRAMIVAALGSLLTLGVAAAAAFHFATSSRVAPGTETVATAVPNVLPTVAPARPAPARPAPPVVDPPGEPADDLLVGEPDGLAGDLQDEPEDELPEAAMRTEPTRRRAAPTRRAAPAPAPEPEVVEAPEPEEDPDDGVAAIEVVEEAPAPAPTEAPVLGRLVNLEVSAEGDRVVIRGTMDSANLKPFHYPLDGADSTYPSQYIVQFKGAASDLPMSKFPVGSPLVSNVTVRRSNGKLLITVNSKAKAGLSHSFQRSGASFTLVVSK